MYEARLGRRGIRTRDAQHRGRHRIGELVGADVNLAVHGRPRDAVEVGVGRVDCGGHADGRAGGEEVEVLRSSVAESGVAGEVIDRAGDVGVDVVATGYDRRANGDINGVLEEEAAARGDGRAVAGDSYSGIRAACEDRIADGYTGFTVRVNGTTGVVRQRALRNVMRSFVHCYPNTRIAGN